GANMAAVFVEWCADVRFTVFHQRPGVNTAGHRQQYRTAYGKLPDSVDAVDSSDDWIFFGRQRGSVIRIRTGVRFQRSIICFFRLLRIEVACCGGLSPATRRSLGGQSTPAVAGI